MALPGTPRDRLRSILAAAVSAADPSAAVSRSICLEDEVLVFRGEAIATLAETDRVWLLGAGKASPRMAEALLRILGSRVRGGLITTKPGNALRLPGIDVWEAAHPIPDAHGLAAAAETLELARRAGEDDLVVCLLSGGASALWPAPPHPVTLNDLQGLTQLLLRAGSPIAELNTVRKHLSRIAGGGLARAAAPARVVTLAISDVIGVSPDVIGSGPTLPDPTTFADALDVLHTRGVDPPRSIQLHLEAGAAGTVPETLKPGELSHPGGFHVLAGVRDALEGAAAAAAALGYEVSIVSDAVEGEAREVGGEIVQAALAARDAARGPVALLWGGETTVTVRGAGQGGRNQELALAAAIHLEGEDGVLIASIGTDGTDGPTDAAGGAVDGGTVARARSAGLDPAESLARNDSYPLLRATGDLLVTGPTGTNVNDVIVVLVG